jgi:hypothetical protein
VTPSGVRNGDPAALAGLCERRGPAVLAYCRQVAGDAAATAAAAEAFAHFRAEVVAAEDPASINPEALLISATRHAAARHASVVAVGLCAEVPALLAGRADRSISPANVEFLEGHLDVCWTCRAPVARFQAAERAYRNPPDEPVPPDAAEAIVTALAAVRMPDDEPPAEVSPPIGAHVNGTGRLTEAPGAPDERAPVEVPDPATTEYRALDDDYVPRPRSTAGDSGRRRGRRARGPAPRPSSGTSLPRPVRTSPVVGVRRERAAAMRPSVMLPVVLVATAFLVALFVSGVLGADDPASSPTSVAPPPPPAAPASTTKPEVVVVPGAGAASAGDVERAKARARAKSQPAGAPDRPEDSAPTSKPTPPATAPSPTAVRPPVSPSGGTTPKVKPKPKPKPKPAPRRHSDAGVDADHGATGVQRQLPSEGTTTVHEPAPPVEPSTPTPQPPG